MNKFQLSTFDKQYDEIDKEVKFCKNCVVPDKDQELSLIQMVFASLVYGHMKKIL